MSPENRKPAVAHADWSGNQGGFRAILGGPGHTLADAFATLERAPRVERVRRHPTRDVIGARVAVAREEGAGYRELTRIRDEIHVIVANFAYEDTRIKLVPGDGLVQAEYLASVPDPQARGSRSRITLNGSESASPGQDR